MHARSDWVRPLALALILCVVLSVQAQSSTTSDALNAQAQQSFADGDYPAAATHLEQALAAWDGPHDDVYLTIKLNLAMTYLKLDRAAEGQRLLKEVEREGTEMARRAQEATQ